MAGEHSVQLINTLTEKLSELRELQEMGSQEQENLAHSLIDIQESSAKINDLVSSFKSKGSIDSDQLFEISQELKHILYHVSASKYLTVYAGIKMYADKPE